MAERNEAAPREGAPRERLADIGEIAAEAAHELRNVLLVISSSAYLARLDPAASAPHIAKIERSTRLAQGIVDDVMSLARGEPLGAGPIAIADIVTSARAELDGSAATWEDRIDPPDLRVRAHPGLLTRVLHALYDNAIRVSAQRPAPGPRVPTITTRAFRDGAHVVLEIADNGPGVRAALVDSLFDPLVTDRPGGSGLGLALAKRIVTAHGGSIALVPNAENAPPGATFRLLLP